MERIEKIPLKPGWEEEFDLEPRPSKKRKIRLKMPGLLLGRLESRSSNKNK